MNTGLVSAGEFKFLPAYHPIFYADRTYFLVEGGRASGKSTNIAAYFLVKLLGEDFFRGVIARYTQKSITNSIYRDILDLAEAWNITRYLEVSGDNITYKKNGNAIITHAMRLSDGTMTARGKGLARCTHLLIDEATELPSEGEYIKLIDSFRQKGVERKIFLLFNPTTKQHWIFRRFFLPDGTLNPKWNRTHFHIHTTYKDNIENIDPSKIEEWEEMRTIDPEYYEHHIEGKWLDNSSKQIFKNWKFGVLNPDPDSRVYYGLDWGFTDPVALVKVWKKGNKVWIKQLIHLPGITNQQLIEEMLRLGVPTDAVIIADRSEPKSIQEVKTVYKRIKEALKPPGSVKSGIKHLQSLEVFVDATSTELIEEYYNYITDRHGEPIDAWNHAIDAIRYALNDSESTGKYSTYGGGTKKPVGEFTG